MQIIICTTRLLILRLAGTPYPTANSYVSNGYAQMRNSFWDVAWKRHYTWNAGDAHRYTSLLCSAYESAVQVSRRQLLEKTTSANSPTSTTMVGVTTFHSKCQVFPRSLRKNWPILGQSTTTGPLFDLKLIIAYMRTENLGDILIWAKLPNPHNPACNFNRRHPHNRCTTCCCSYCLALNRSGKITSHTTGRSYVSMKNVTSKSSNL